MKGGGCEGDDHDDTLTIFVVVLLVVHDCVFLACKIRLAKCRGGDEGGW
jgi:hypothetical protein